MSEMIERVAKAIHFRRVGGYFVNLNWDTISEVKRNDYRGYAQAAIEALMEPTFDMMDEGMSHEITAFREDRGQQYSELTNAHVGGSSIKGLWQAMLAAAIAPPNPTTESKDE